MLESRLDAIDQAEVRELYLGCHRRDRNPERKQVLDEITVLLKEYGAYPLRFPLASYVAVPGEVLPRDND